jgi:hypothetical protein
MDAPILGNKMDAKFNSRIIVFIDLVGKFEKRLETSRHERDHLKV